MNSLGLDPKITLAIYIGGAIVFIAALLTIFLYSRNLKMKRTTQDALGRAPVDKEEGIAIATEKGKKF